MRTILVIILISTWQIGFCQKNDCAYNQLDSAGEKHGSWVIYRSTGENSYIHAHGWYEHGAMTGTWHYWKNGFLSKKEIHDKGIVDFAEYYDNNQPKVTGKYFHVLNVGTDTSDVINPLTGLLETVIHNKPSTEVKCGTWKYYSKDGKLERTETY